MTNAEARCNNSLRPRKPEGSLGRTAQDGHLDSHTAPELCALCFMCTYVHILYSVCYFTGILYAVVRKIAMLFIDNRDFVFSSSQVNWLTLGSRGLVRLR